MSREFTVPLPDGGQITGTLSDLLCAASVPLDGTREGRWIDCDRPAVAVHVYGCVHEHIKTLATCEGHTPVPGAVGCRDCLNAGHECAMSYTPVQVTS